MKSMVPDCSFTIKFMTRDKKAVEAFFEEVRSHIYKPSVKNTYLYVNSGDGWNYRGSRKPRPIESVILPAGVKEPFLADVQDFIDSQEWYVGLGLPHRRAYLLHGPPGTGKSSLVAAIAGFLKRDVKMLSLAESGMSDSKLIGLLATCGDDDICLLEDIDAAFAFDRTSSDDASKLTFSGLLNAIDGVGAKDGRILFMSTNHPEKLDPALVRPGRVDYRLHLGNADDFQARTLFERFFPETNKAEDFVRLAGGERYSMATLQNHLLLNRRDEAKALTEPEHQEFKKRAIYAVPESAGSCLSPERTSTEEKVA